MPSTVADIQEQRAKILEEIESKVGKIPTSPKKAKTPSLTEWLNAAETVMPEEEKPTKELDFKPEEAKSSKAASSDTHSKTVADAYVQTSQSTSHNINTEIDVDDEVKIEKKSNKLLSSIFTKSEDESEKIFKIIIVFTLMLTAIGMAFITYSYNNDKLATEQNSTAVLGETATDGNKVAGQETSVKANQEEATASAETQQNLNAEAVPTPQTEQVANAKPKAINPLSQKEVQMAVIELQDQMKLLETKMGEMQTSMNDNVRSVLDAAIEQQQALKLKSQIAEDRKYFFELERL